MVRASAVHWLRLVLLGQLRWTGWTGCRVRTRSTPSTRSRSALPLSLIRLGAVAFLLRFAPNAVQPLIKATVRFKIAGLALHLPVQQAACDHAIHMADVGRDLGEASARLPLMHVRAPACHIIHQLESAVDQLLADRIAHRPQGELILPEECGIVSLQFGDAGPGHIGQVHLDLLGGRAEQAAFGNVPCTASRSLDHLVARAAPWVDIADHKALGDILQQLRHLMAAQLFVAAVLRIDVAIGRALRHKAKVLGKLNFHPFQLVAASPTGLFGDHP